MGLDMYAFSIDVPPPKAVDFDANVDGVEIRRIAYWRKHPDLHDWMGTIYRQKGGSSDLFNCVPVLLTSDDLDTLELYVQAEKLPVNHGGFFFGKSQPEDKTATLAFIKKAREEISAGRFVFYTSWW